MRDWGWKHASHWVQSVIPQTKTRQWDSESKSTKVKSDSLKCSSPHISLSFAPIPSLSPSSSLPALALCLFVESPVGNVNRDFTAQCRCIGRAHISPTCDLHQRRGSWGIFHASEGRGAVTVTVMVEMVAREVGGRVVVLCTLGPDAVRDSNNGGTDRPAERCFYCKENLHDCIQALLLKCHHPPYTALVWVSPSSFSAFLEIGARASVPVSLQVCFCMYNMYWLCTM